jgi:glyoxylase-like metal-dependent hydrolase (beta-lactamase superfamily II)
MGQGVGRRRVLAAGLTLLVLTLAAVGGRAWLNRDRAQPASASPRRPGTVAPGVYRVDLWPSAAYLVETTDGLVLVDTGIESDDATVIGRLHDWGFDLDRLRYIFLTHAHGDHSLGAEHLRQLTGARIYAGRGDAQVLRAGRPREAFFSYHRMPSREIHPTTVDHEWIGGEVLDVGDAHFQVLATPGHTPGSVCYLMERDGRRTLFTGDTIQTLTNDLGTYAAHLAPRYRGDAKEYLSSLRALLALPEPDYVLVGHPNSEKLPTSPRVAKAQWHTLLEEGMGEMRQLLARFQDDGRNFLDGVPKTLLAGLHYLGDFHGRAVYCLATTSPRRLFLFDAPGGAGLVKFVKGRLRDLGVAWSPPTAVLLASGDPEATAGLPELVRVTGCQVIVSAAGLPALKEACPPHTRFLAADRLAAAGWFPVRVVALQGRGLAPVAYLVDWQHKAVLVSGRVPMPTAPESGPEEGDALRKALTAPGGDAVRYRQTLATLRGLRPDLWLPAVPVDGQNANLYDGAWERVLRANENLLP